MKHDHDTKLAADRDSRERNARSLALNAALGLMMVLAPFVGAQVQAADFAVTSTDDLEDANVGDGSCDGGAGTCTLRAAIQEANGLGGSHTITLPAGTFTLTIEGRNEDFAAAGDLDVRTDLTITGAGANSTIISGGVDMNSGIDRLLEVHEVTFQLTDVTLEHGRLVDAGAAGDGAGLLNNGSSTVTRTRIRACLASGAGGAIQTTGTATLVLGEALLDGNVAPDGGGLSVAGGGLVNASNVTITGNTSTLSLGGGVSVAATATANLANATVVGNHANVIIGGGISNAGTTTLKGSIVAANTNQGGTSGNCAGGIAVTSNGYNLDDATSCGFSNTGDWSSANPLLGALADNGGPTATHALTAGSPAIDGADPAGCTAAQGGALTIDQRGLIRPVDGDGNGSQICDIGAFELQGAGDSLIFSDGFESADTTVWSNAVGSP